MFRLVVLTDVDIAAFTLANLACELVTVIQKWVLLYSFSCTNAWMRLMHSYKKYGTIIKVYYKKYKY